MDHRGAGADTISQRALNMCQLKYLGGSRGLWISGRERKIQFRLSALRKTVAVSFVDVRQLPLTCSVLAHY
jgi:hypothetical protein